MFICLDCGCVFEELKHWVEKHGFLFGPWEEWRGCPSCGGDYTDAIRCEVCEEYITGTYIKVIDGQLICENCYTVKELGE